MLVNTFARCITFTIKYNYLRQGGYVSSGVRLSVYLSVFISTLKKTTDRTSWKFYLRCIFDKKVTNDILWWKRKKIVTYPNPHWKQRVRAIGYGSQQRDGALSTLYGVISLRATSARTSTSTRASGRLTGNLHGTIVGPTGRTDCSRIAHLCQSNQCGLLAD